MPSPAHFTSTQLHKRKRQPATEDAQALPEKPLSRTGFRFKPQWRQWLNLITNRSSAKRPVTAREQP